MELAICYCAVAAGVCGNGRRLMRRSSLRCLRFSVGLRVLVYRLRVVVVL